MLSAELENLNSEDNEDGAKDNEKNIAGTKSGKKSVGKSNNKSSMHSGKKSGGKKNKDSTSPSAQATDSFVTKDGEVNGGQGSVNSASDTVDKLKAALESDKELTVEEIATAKETIMGFRNAAAILIKKAEDLEKLLAN